MTGNEVFSMPKVTFQIEGAAPVVAECNLGDDLLELA